MRIPKIRSQRPTTRLRSFLVLLAFGLIAAACGSDSGDSASSGGSSASAVTAAPATTAAPAVEDPVIVGYVLSGPTNDGGFYEDQANGTNNVAAELGYEVRMPAT
jgi:hypothetical protein